LRFVFAQYKQDNAGVLDNDTICNGIIQHRQSRQSSRQKHIPETKGIVPMKEKDLRRYHRITGVVLAVFIIAQAGTGLIFTIGKMAGNPESHDHGTAGISMSPVSTAFASGSESEESDVHESLLSTVHYGGGMIGDIYRLLLAVALIGQVCGGVWIYIRIRNRKQANS
jgi:succinate dehydrogenase/fumarate reductase cytochrome b subunit